MKIFRIFEEFVNHTANIGYVKVKMQELQELATDVLTSNDKFKWKIEDDQTDGYVLDIDLTIGKQLLNVEFDLDKLQLGMYSNLGHLDFTGMVSSLEDGMDRIEKAIYNHIGVKEKKS